MKNKSPYFAIWVLLMILPLLVSCAKKKVELCIVVEQQSQWEGIGPQVATAVKAFEKEHKDVTVIVEELPDENDGRELALEQLRAAIMSGKGPDVLLLPCSSSIADPLFSDVNQAMRNGVFADISQYYDADTSLSKDDLLPAVMDAGVVDGIRYVLPLRYNIPVAYVDGAQFEAAGLSPDVFDTGLEGLMRAAIESGDDKLAADTNTFRILYSLSLNFFPDLMDYDGQQITLPKEKLTAFMTLYQALVDIQGLRDPYWGAIGFTEYIGNSFPYWATGDHIMYISDLNTALPNAAVAQIEGIDLEIFPLTAADGTLTADVTLWGAISAGCKNKELAYEFLTMFLSEGYQLQEDCSAINSLYSGLIENGWPVRIKSNVQKLYKNVSIPFFKEAMSWDIGEDLDVQKARARKLKFVELTDDDFPDFHTEIDQARFSIPQEVSFAKILRQELNNMTTGEAKNVDIDTLAGDFIHDLEWHMGEG